MIDYQIVYDIITSILTFIGAAALLGGVLCAILGMFGVGHD